MCMQPDTEEEPEQEQGPAAAAGVLPQRRSLRSRASSLAPAIVDAEAAEAAGGAPAQAHTEPRELPLLLKTLLTRSMTAAHACEAGMLSSSAAAAQALRMLMAWRMACIVQGRQRQRRRMARSAQLLRAGSA